MRGRKTHKQELKFLDNTRSEVMLEMFEGRRLRTQVLNAAPTDYWGFVFGSWSTTPN